MSDKKEMRVQHLTCKRYGQSVEYVTAIINKFDPEIHNKIVIEHVPVTQLQSLQERLDIAVGALEEIIENTNGGHWFAEQAIKRIEGLSREGELPL